MANSSGEPGTLYSFNLLPYSTIIQPIIVMWAFMVIYWKILVKIILLHYCWRANHLITSMVNVFPRTQLANSVTSCSDINDRSNFYFNTVLKNDDVAISKLPVCNYKSLCHARYLGRPLILYWAWLECRITSKCIIAELYSYWKTMF